MKVGDKYYCKKDCSVFSDVLFSKDSIYIVEKVKESRDYNSGELNFKLYFRGNDGDDYWFLLNSKEYFYIYKYFYSLSESRKLKLKKLNNISE